MGTFVYDSNVKVEFEDRLFAHLQAVIMVKVRRGETFTFTWKDDISTGGGRTCVYIHSGVSLVFRFHGGRMPQLNPAWLHALTFNANSSRGLYIVAARRVDGWRSGNTPLATGSVESLHRGPVSWWPRLIRE